LSTSVPGSRGSFWSTESNPYKDWEAIYSFQISGRDTHGREGLAFWYTEERGVLGPIMGNQDMWNGLAVFQDTYDDLYNVILLLISLILDTYYYFSHLTLSLLVF
jgi:mannose-binding lectin 1